MRARSTDARARARCDQGSRDGLLRSARSVHRDSEGADPRAAVRQLRGQRRGARADRKPLQGMRIAILREHMVKQTLNHEAISRPDRQGDQDRAARPARRRAGRDHRRRATRTIRTCRTSSTRSPMRCPSCCRASCRRSSRAATRTASCCFAVPGLRRHVVRLPAEVEQAPGAADDTIDITNFGTFAAIAVPCRPSAATSVRPRPLSRAIAATRGSRTGPPGSRTPNSARTSRAPARRTGSTSRITRSTGKARPPRAQPRRAHGAAQGDVRERHRRVRASREHGADAEDPGSERRHDQPRRHHAVLPDSAHRRAGRRRPTSSTSRSTR